MNQKPQDYEIISDPNFEIIDNYFDKKLKNNFRLNKNKKNRKLQILKKND